MNNRIYIKDWLELKPYDKQTATDGYYLKICNEVKTAITSPLTKLVSLRVYMDEEYINLLSCFLTSYFEDIISETNIWNTFIKAHKKLYNKPIPFYEGEEYYENEINKEDVSFLIWYFLNVVQDNKFIPPSNDFITELADDIMLVFDQEWEYAPENEYLKSFYQIDENEEDFYTVRTLIDTLLFKTYLFYPDAYLKLEDTLNKILENHRDNENLLMFMNDAKDATLHKIHTHLLGFRGKDWAAELLDNKLSKELRSMSKRIQGFFLYKGQDDKNIFIEHIAAGKTFHLLKKSFDLSHTLTEIDTMLFMGIVQWKNEWWFSGVFTQTPFDAKIADAEKESIEGKMDVSFLDHQKKESDKILARELTIFKEYNNGSQIAFLPEKDIEAFQKGYLKFLQKSSNLFDEEIEIGKQKAKELGFNQNHKTVGSSDSEDAALVFFNPNKGVEIAYDFNSAFPMASNPYFKEKNSEEDIIHLLTHDEGSKELTMFCVENAKDKLPFFKTIFGKYYLEYKDFFLRFWKREAYHTTPAITYI